MSVEDRESVGEEALTGRGVTFSLEPPSPPCFPSPLDP